MALRGIKVLEFAGLAPGPFCGKILADHGASVLRIDRLPQPNFSVDVLADNKKSISLNLKGSPGIKIMKELVATSDVLIEPFRAETMERMGLGPDTALEINPALIYARLSGFGQNGNWRHKAGHDINFLSLSGVLSRLGRANSKPTPPQNLLADFAGGGLMCAMGIILALFERSRKGIGQVVDCSMTASSAYIASFFFHSKDLFPFITQQKTGENLLDSGCPFYDTYKTLDGKFMAVGALEPQFFQRVIEKLNLVDKYSTSQMDPSIWEEMRKDFELQFAKSTQKEWGEIFENVDACVSPVLDLDEAVSHDHNREADSFVDTKSGVTIPNVSPILSESPGAINVNESARILPIGANTEEVLNELGYSSHQVTELVGSNVVYCHNTASKL